MWLESDSDPAVTGEVVTLWVTTDWDTVPVFAAVEWDFDYDGVSFDPAAGPDLSGGPNPYTTTTFDTAGPRTVAARLTDAGGAVRIVTLGLTVENPPPEVAVPAEDVQAVAGSPVTLAVTVTSAVPVASVAWWLSSDGEEYELASSLTTLSGPYTFELAGEYDAWVVVTDTAGHTGEGWFHITAANPAPVSQVTITYPDGSPIGSAGVTEGTTVSFAVHDLSVDDLDTTTVYVDWTGDGVFSQLNAAGTDFWFDLGDPDTVRFDHRYDDDDGRDVFQVTVRLEDEWGTYDYEPVPLKVQNVAPAVTISAGRVLATPAGSGRLVYALMTNENVTQVVTEPSNADRAGLTYYWQFGTGDPVQTAVNFCPLPSYASGAVYDVRAWTEDKNGGKSAVQEFTAVADQGSPGGAGGLGLWGGVGSGAIYGGLYLGATFGEQPAGVSYPGYNRYSYRPQISLPEQTPGQPTAYFSEDTAVPVQYVLDAHSTAFAATLQATPVYHLKVDIYDVGRSSFSGQSNTIISTVESSSPTPTFTLPPIPKDRKVIANGWATLDKDGVQLRTTIYSQVVYETPKTPTTLEWFQETVTPVIDTIQGFRDLANQFGSRASALIDAINADYEKVFRVLSNGLTQALRQFATTLPDALQTKLAEWLGVSNVQRYLNADWTDGAVWQSLLLEYSGLTWDHVYQVVQERLGAGNLAAAEAVATWFTRPNGGGDFAPTDPRAMADFLAALPGRVGEGLVNADLNGLANDLVGKIKDKLTDAVTRAGVQLAAKFIPGAGAALSAFRGLQWVMTNQQQLAGVFTRFLESLDGLTLDEGEATAWVKDKMLLGFKDAVVPLMNLAATQLGLGNLRGELQRVAAYVPQRVDGAIRKAVDAVAARVPAAANGTAAVPGGNRADGGAAVFNGRLADAREFVYQGKTYVLWVATDKLGTKVKVAERVNGAYPRVIELTGRSFVGAAAASHIGTLMSAAQAVHARSKAAPPPGTPRTNPLLDLRQLQAAVTAAEGLVINDILANACVALGTGCFAAGTRLWTPAGHRAVEDMLPGDVVFARSEYDPDGPVEPKAVEARFERTGRILHLHFPGGVVVRTTPEHPFYDRTGEWVPAGALAIGDEVRTAAGWAVVEDVFDTGVFERVYNLRVADHHTYFVGDDHWGFSLWAHNAYDSQLPAAQVASSPQDLRDVVTVAAAARAHREQGVVSGGHTTGYIPTRMAGNYFVVRAVTGSGVQTHIEFGTSGSANHSEPKMAAWFLQNHVTQVLAAFSEHVPCAPCSLKPLPAMRKLAGAFTTYWGVPIGSEDTASNQALLDWWGQTGVYTGP